MSQVDFKDNLINLETVVEQHEGEADEVGYENQNHPPVGVSHDLNQLSVLRQLLIVERQRNEQRRDNNNVMQRYLVKLQADYLRLQADLVEALELGHKIKAQKEAQMEAMKLTIEQKDKTIEKLNLNMTSIDHHQLGEDFKLLVEKQTKLFQLEREQLESQIKNMELQLLNERTNHSQQLQQTQSRFEEQLRNYDKELRVLRGRLQDNDSEIERILNEPKNLLIKSLKEEKCQLQCDLDESRMLLQENQTKYDSLKRRMESLLGEQETMEQKNLDEFEKIQDIQSNLRRTINELKMNLEDKEEVIQIQQFNLQRSEKRVKSLVVSLQGKESTYKQMIEALQNENYKQLQEIETERKILQTKMINYKNELDKKQNELMQIRLEFENQLESLKNDRDFRLVKLTQERDKLDKKVQSVELKLIKETEEKENKIKQIELLQKESNQFREESKRLSIEVSKFQAKLHSAETELNQMIREHELTKDNEQNSTRTNQMLSLNYNLERSKNCKLIKEIESSRKERNDLEKQLKIQESLISKSNQSIDREHVKLINEYKKRLENLKEQQLICDQNRIRYRRYGCKLKKHCEHLRKIHEHICDPLICRASDGNLNHQLSKSAFSLAADEAGENTYEEIGDEN